MSISSKLKDVAMILFLPVSFALAGFSTDLKLLKPETFGVVAIVLAGAMAASSSRLPLHPRSASNGARLGCWVRSSTPAGCWSSVGLIGVTLEIIAVTTFTIIVVVALVTNLMTLPLLTRFSPKRAGEEAPRRASPKRGLSSTLPKGPCRTAGPLPPPVTNPAS